MRRAIGPMAVALLAFALIIASCGESIEAGAPDGVLDCSAGERWTATYESAGSGGQPTPFGAMEGFAADAYGDEAFEINVLTARTATVVIDGSEVALVSVEELGDETYVYGRVDGCAGFEGDFEQSAGE